MTGDEGVTNVTRYYCRKCDFTTIDWAAYKRHKREAH